MPVVIIMNHLKAIMNIYGLFCQVLGGGYNNAMINIGGHFTRCHISVNIGFTNLCSRNQFQHPLKYEYHILLEIHDDEFYENGKS